MKKIYLIAGEASGDLHGSNLMKALLKENPDLDFRFWGGDKMQDVAGTLVKHYKELAFMGFAEVIKNLPTILGNLSFCKKDIKEYQPDAVIFIDYPGFNLRMAPFVKGLGIQSLYYISPQLWAWKSGRINTIKKYVDRLFVILPFEKQWYADRGYEVDFVGHPLIDAIAQSPSISWEDFKSKHHLQDKPIIALLPGSRKQEIEKKLQVMLQMVEKFPSHQFLVAGAPSQDADFYNSIIQNKAQLIQNDTYGLLQHAQAALVTSGTATLETALHKVPQVVCYKGSWLSYQIGKRLVKHIQYISLVNLIMDEEVVTELIQDDFTAEKLTQELQHILEESTQKTLKNKYDELEKKLGGTGASQHTAQKILQCL